MVEHNFDSIGVDPVERDFIVAISPSAKSPKGSKSVKSQSKSSTKKRAKKSPCKAKKKSSYLIVAELLQAIAVVESNVSSKIGYSCR